MSLESIDRSDVLAAIEEFRRLGREEFLRRYGFGRAKAYFLVLDGDFYDSKAIVGYAHGIRGEPLTAADFSGGEKTVAQTLRDLGFVVQVRRNPPWTRDEVVLACELVYDNNWLALAAEDPRVRELSELLQRQVAHPLHLRGDDFRNANGVARKTVDIATRHHDYRGKPTKGGQLDEPVLREFIEDPGRMKAEASALRVAIRVEFEHDADLVDLDLDGHSAEEGRVLERLHLRRERDPALRRRAIAAYKARHGFLACEVCGFDFGATYGPHGEDYIECHHRVPLHVSGPTTTRIEDLAMVCSNCHRMIHRRSSWLAVEALRDLVRARREVVAQ